MSAARPADSAWLGCAGACDQGRSPCNCAAGMPRSHPINVPEMFDVETERPWLTSAVIAIAFVATVAISALLVGCGGSDDAAATPDTPTPRPPTCAASGACA